MSSPKYKGHGTSSSNFVPLDLEQRTHVDTASAAYHLGRKAQTMRVWGVDRAGTNPASTDQRTAEPASG